MSIRVRRVYDPPEPDDGYRVLIDGLWPRGIGKPAAKLDSWARDREHNNAVVLAEVLLELTAQPTP